MIILMKGTDESKNVKRLLEDFHDEAWVDQIIMIDGGSHDFTVHDMKQFDKVEVYTHPWINDYHDMEVSQSNIALSYIPHGKVCYIIDFDERFSPELKQELADINKTGMPDGVDLGNSPRRTYELMRYEDSPYAMMDDDGWPVISHQIGQYPDYQPRLIRRKVGMVWVNSPHHRLLGIDRECFLKGDIIHFEKEDYRDRIKIEKKWALAQARRKALGLTPDVFEGRVMPELHKYTDPETWK